MINSPTDLQSIVKDATKKLILKSSTSVPSDILQELYRIRQEEKNSEINLSQIDLMVENIEYGCENKIPICQDTGLVNFFLKVGDQFPLKTQLNEIFLECLEELTQESKIR